MQASSRAKYRKARTTLHCASTARSSVRPLLPRRLRTIGPPLLKIMGRPLWQPPPSPQTHIAQSVGMPPQNTTKVHKTGRANRQTYHPRSAMMSGLEMTSMIPTSCQTYSVQLCSIAATSMFFTLLLHKPDTPTFPLNRNILRCVPGVATGVPVVSMAPLPPSELFIEV